MAPGSWSLSLDPDRAREGVWRRMGDAIGTYGAATDKWTTNLDGYVAVFSEPVRTSTPNIENATYVGQMLSASGRATFAGEGIAALWNRRNGIGLVNNVASTTNSRTLSQWMDYVLPFNGLTKGTVTMTGLSSWSGKFQLGQGARELMAEVCNGVGGADWRINHDWTVDAGPEGSLHRNGEVIITTGDVSSTGSIRGIQGSVIGFELDASNTAERVHVAPAGDGEALQLDTTTAGSARGYTPTGVAAQFHVAIDAPNVEPADAGTYGASVLGLRAAPRDAFRVRVADPHVFWYVDEGDTVYLYDHHNFIDDGNPIAYAGGVVRPQIKRVHSMAGPVPNTASVWLFEPNADQWTDLTDAVIFDRGDTFLTVGQGRGPADWVDANGGPWLGSTQVAV